MGLRRLVRLLRLVTSRRRGARGELDAPIVSIVAPPHAPQERPHVLDASLPRGSRRVHVRPQLGHVPLHLASPVLLLLDVVVVLAAGPRRRRRRVVVAAPPRRGIALEGRLPQRLIVVDRSTVVAVEDALERGSGDALRLERERGIFSVGRVEEVGDAHVGDVGTRLGTPLGTR